MTDSAHVPVVTLSAADLNTRGGVYCPHPQSGMQAWSSHPRVFLSVAANGQAQCPYCGTRYQLPAAAAL